MNHDPKCFPDHDVFRPERYLDDEGRLTDAIPNTHHLGHLTFGTGRRCVLLVSANGTDLHEVQDVPGKRSGHSIPVHGVCEHAMGFQHGVDDRL